MDDIVVKKICPLGHDKTQMESGRWYCRKCSKAKRAKSDAAKREEEGLPPVNTKSPLAEAGPRKCHRGHLKEQRPAGHWVCNTCSRLNSIKKNERAREALGRPAKARKVPPPTPAGKYCIRGHEKAVRHNGVVVCFECRNVKRRALAKLRASGGCDHSLEDNFEGLLTNDERLVCVDCLVAEYAQDVRPHARVG